MLFHGVTSNGAEIGETWIVTEFCKRGSLRNCIDDGSLESMGFDELMGLAVQILSGIRYLHDEANPPVVHRDLKSANVLVTHDWVMKLCDFGSAKRKSLRQETLAGTAAYAAPEMLRQEEDLMGSPVDVWSFGVILWEIITLEIPHHSLDQWVILIRGGMGKLRLLVPDETPAEVKQLLDSCWEFHPMNRPPAAELLQRLGAIAGAARDRMRAVIGNRPLWRGAMQERMRREADMQSAEYTRLKNVERRNVQLTVGLAVAVVVIALLAVVIGMQAGDVTVADQTFKEGNLDNNAVVSLAELRKLGAKGVLQTLGMNIDSDEELSSVLAKYDAHKYDGGLDKEEFEDLIAGETSYYSAAREQFMDFFGVDPTFSLSVHLRSARDAVPFGEAVATIIGVGLLGVSVVWPQQALTRDTPIDHPISAVLGTLILATLGAYLLAFGTIDLIYGHLSTRELLQFGSVVFSVWFLTTLLGLAFGARSLESGRHHASKKKQ